MLFIKSTISQPNIVCPNYFNTNGYINDLGLLAEAASWNDITSVNGVCHTYNKVFESHGIYDTRMIVYEADNIIVFTFRPTQQNDESGKIHLNRRLVSVSFFNDGVGYVNDRMQQAFESLTKDFPYEIIRNKDVLMGSHSLGAIFTQFQMVYLKEVFNITTKLNLGFAGPFIGDLEFTEKYLYQFKNNSNCVWWQVETVNKNDFDGTVTQYNVDYAPFIFIEIDAVCGLNIIVQKNTYGMHDLINYRSALVGNYCVKIWD
jgi:hypothetical protein